MKLEPLLLSAFLVGSSEGFVHWSPASCEITCDSSCRKDGGGRSAAAIRSSHHATAGPLPCRPSRKRRRATRAAVPMTSSGAEGEGSSALDATAAAAATTATSAAAAATAAGAAAALPATATTTAPAAPPLPPLPAAPATTATTSAAAATAPDASMPLLLPPRLQETVDRLENKATLLDKSKLLVEIGDAFALTDSAVLPQDSGSWFSQRVPGCVSEVNIAVSVRNVASPSPSSSAEAAAEALALVGTGVGVRAAAGDALGGTDAGIAEAAGAAGAGATAVGTGAMGGASRGDTGVVSIRGTADARLSRGILALVASGLEGESPHTVLNLCGKTLAAAVGLRAGLTNSRINGLGNVLGVIQAQVRTHLERAAAADQADATTTDTELTSAEPTSAEPTSAEPTSLGPAGAGLADVESPASVTVDSPSLLLSGDGASFTEEGRRSWGSDASGWFPLPGAEDEVAMLLSGGVDSSVAMRLLQDEGYRVRAFYLKIWLEDELSHLGECPWEEDLRYAAAVCEQAGVPLEVVPLQREYWEQVVSYTVREAREGRTPNPDVMCNSRIKFGMFYDHVGRHFRHVATGHYARLENVETESHGATEAVGDRAVGDRVGGGDGGGGGGGDTFASKEGGVGQATEREGAQVRLLLSPDAIKDQTYFLCALNQAQLRKALFPVGAYTKERIRELAESYDLPTKSRKDSQGICFLGKLKFDDFLRHYLGEAPGTVIDRETGETIGEHRGLWFHTIGQRKGVGPGLKPGYVNLGPWYVSGKDMVSNVLEVTNNRDAIDEPRESFQVEALQWIAGFPPAELEREGSMRLQVKTRHGPQMKGCTLRLREETKPAYSGEADLSGTDGEADVVGGGGGGGIGGASREVEAVHGRGYDVVGGSGGGGVASGGGETTGGRGYVLLDNKDSALAPGQFAAFYLGDECLGSGVIGDSSSASGRGEEAVTPPAALGEVSERVSSTPALQESTFGA